jgi:hypothetical protein
MKTFHLPRILKILVILVGQLLAVCCLAAPPARLDAYVYYENTLSLGAGDAKTSTHVALSFRGDGTFSGLFRVTLAPFFSPPYRLSNEPDGTYSYKVLDNQTAELELNFTGSTDGASKRTLRFTADDSGSISTGPDVVGIVQTFRLSLAATRTPLSNCSNRSFVRAGGSAFTGFVVASGGSGWVLVRATGPSLAQFGVAATLRNPRINVSRSGGASTVAANDDWGIDGAQAVNRTSALVGAFPLLDGSKDSAIVLNVSPGAYVAQVSSPEAEDSGEALIEVYQLP